MQLIEFEACGAQVKGYIHEDHDRLVAHKVRPALIVCPGGGYYLVSPREADPPALEYAAMGYNVFILTYSILEEAKDYRPLRQLADTVAIVRRNCEVWHIDPLKIAVMGFSAGGHLAASLGALWRRPELDLPRDSRPDALILCYPVITMGRYTHTETRANVTGGDDNRREVFSIEKQIKASFPPTFLWHTMDDPDVPVENSMLLMQALQRKGIAMEAHFFAHGPHGISTCNVEVETPEPACRSWVELSKTWLNNQFGYTP